MNVHSRATQEIIKIPLNQSGHDRETGHKRSKKKKNFPPVAEN